MNFRLQKIMITYVNLRSAAASDVKTPRQPKALNEWDIHTMRADARRYLRLYASRTTTSFNSSGSIKELDFSLQTDFANFEPAPAPGYEDLGPQSPPPSPTSQYWKDVLGILGAHEEELDAGRETPFPFVPPPPSKNAVLGWFQRKFGSAWKLKDSILGLIPEGEQLEFCLKLIEDMSLFMRLFMRARDREDRILAILCFTKMRKNTSLILDFKSGLMDYCMELFGSDDTPFSVQSGDFIGKSRFILDKWDEIIASPLYKKLYKFIMYAMSLSLFAKVGLTLGRVGFDQASEEAIRRKYHQGPDFVRTCFDTLIFICERGQQCFKTGSLDPLFHSGKSYDEWYAKASNLKRLAPFTNNLEPHGYSIPQFHAELSDTIERGDAIVKHAKAMKEFDAKFLALLLNDLRLISTELLTKKAAMQDRRAPFSILLAGSTSVNKSGLTKLLFYHYGKLFGLPTSAEFKYTRNSIDQYWVNFSTSQWCVQLDDIAFMRPEVATQGDPTLMEMLQVVNNVPFVPIQAALEDKGRTPLLSRFVIATTNTEKLNVHAYFSCPAAITRRFPWVVEVEPHPNFAKEDGTFDSQKAETYTLSMPENFYPNFWRLTVKKVVVHRGTVHADLVVDKVYDNIIDFVSWFSFVTTQYERTQDSALMADKKMSNIQLCSGCHIPQAQCVCSLLPQEEQALHMQSGDQYVIPWRVDVMQKTWNSMKRNIVHEGKNVYDEFAQESSQAKLWALRFWLIMLYLYLHLPLFARVTNVFFGKSWIYTRLSAFAWENGMYRLYMRNLGKRVQAKVSSHKFFSSLLIVLTTGLVVKKAYDRFSSFMTQAGIPSFMGESEPVVEPIEVPVKKTPNKFIPPEKEPWVCQGSNESKLGGVTPIIRPDEKTNIYKKDDFQLTTFDVTPKICSYKGLSGDTLNRLILKNCVAFSVIRLNDPSRTEKFPVRALCLGGKVYVTNNHAMCRDDEFDLIIRECPDEGVTPNVILRVTQDLIRRYPDHDLATITLRGLPARSDITDLFGHSTMRGVHKGYYIGRNRAGAPFQIPVDNMRFEQHPISKTPGCTDFLTNDAGEVILLPMWYGLAARETIKGECGAVLISMSAYGPILLGIHSGGKVGTQRACSTAISREFAKEMLQAQPYTILPSAPMLAAQSAVVELEDLHYKSPFRYMQFGSAHVYGSLSGHRSAMRSRVMPSVMQKAMIAHGHKVEHTRPVTNGWEPKHVQLDPMLKPTTKLNPSLMEQVKQEFLGEILSRLTREDLDMVQVYDDFTAVNGVAGVAYLDKIKRTTSAGFPWKKVKKHFISPIPPVGELRDPVEPSEEIMSRVRQMEERYMNGQRCSIVFNASFKDEPVTHAKAEAKKTRVFAGAPFDATIVIRKLFLSIVRLMQTKRYVFESAPGINASSPEWGDLREYLTTFGPDRIVEGDFKNFDKSMFALIILSAFDILREICAASGNFTPEQLQAQAGVAEDIAFAHYDFFGDLVMFFGTNPSGHPLTVLINGLANGLYMRYCYATLSPEKSAKNFKQNVHLMTYGDDNIMGVSPDCPWFNHTSISSVLSRVGITYTMADKTSKSVPYVHIDTCSFLKRSWRWDEDLQAYCAPLEEASIIRSLMVVTESKSITPEVQAVEILSSAQHEYFHYGKKKFEEMTQFLRDIAHESGLIPYLVPKTFRSWDEYYEMFWKKEKTSDITHPPGDE